MKTCNYLKKLRKDTKISQTELAKKVGISVSILRKIEKGDMEADKDIISFYSNYFDIDKEKLIERLLPEDHSIPLFISDNFDPKFISDGYMVETFIKFKGEDKPLHLNTATPVDSIINAYEYGESIMIYTSQGMVFWINMKEVEILVIHEDGADEYPKIFGNEFLDYCGKDFPLDKEDFLWMMARFYSEDYLITYPDFEYYVRHCKEFASMTSEAIQSTKDSFSDKYADFMESDKVQKMSEDFRNLWGCKINLTNGSDIFIPGLNADLSAEYNILYIIWLADLGPEGLPEKLVFMDNEEQDNMYCIAGGDVRFISFPFTLIQGYKGTQEVTFSHESYTEVSENLAESTNILEGNSNIHYIKGG